MTQTEPANKTATNEAKEEGTHSRVTSNTLIYLFSQLLSWSVSIVMVSIVPRVLGEKAIGQYNLAYTYVGQTALILTLSIEQYLATEIGRDREQTERLLGATLGLRCVCIPLMLLVACLVLFLTKADSTVWILGILVMAGGAIGYLLGPMRFILAGWEDARRVARNDLMILTLQLLALPFLRYGVVIFCLVSQIATLPATIATTLAVAKHIRIRPIFDITLWKHILKESVGFLINDCFPPISAITTSYLLQRYTCLETVGVYSQSQKLLGTFMFVPTALGLALLPTLARLASNNHKEFQEIQRRIMSAMIVMGLPIVLMAFMLAAPFCQLLYGADKFKDLPPAVQLSGLCVIPLYITIMLYRFLVAERKNSIWAGFLFITLLVQAGLCALLIPLTHQSRWHNGALGAIIATAVAETITVICALIVLQCNPFSRSTLSRILRAMLAAAMMGLAMWLTQRFFFVFTASIGLLVFCLAAWKLEALEPEDQTRLATYARQRLAKIPLLKRL